MTGHREDTGLGGRRSNERRGIGSNFLGTVLNVENEGQEEKEREKKCQVQFWQYQEYFESYTF
tara:strand:- start:896 stop:1084 length:189 start_codon:yes stop_codon:yes gene_type:complete